MRSFVEIGLDGSRSPLGIPPGPIGWPRYSPDGRRLAYQAGQAVRLFESATGESPLIDPDGVGPEWSSGGDHIYFTSRRDGTSGLDGFRRRSNLGAAAELLFSRDGNQWINDAAPGDSLLVGREFVQDRGNNDLVLVRVPRGPSSPDTARVELYLSAEWEEYAPAIAPGGRHVAYTAERDGELALFVQTFPVPTGAVRVVPGSATDPVWAPDGRTLFYRDGTRFMAVDVDTDAAFEVVSTPRLVFTAPAHVPSPRGTNWDLHPDGTRFVVTESTGESGKADAQDQPGPVLIVTAWFAELRARMAGN